ncbi:alpha/beta hydrolase [Bombilactobacillus bombi]|uniref:Alpha/beta hydrolase n=1 Tax=Bombilactobacillus bombi TaxID=1303590 RepID=A0A3R6VA86_9LACO|nr:alpha/beta hydrolase [Bombilactobacillus bombi]RHW51152.1 alpha/beta hydrolase [Bombilactobacillus bombi]
MNFLTTDQVRISYQDMGAGQPIVLLAGLGSYSTVWQLTQEFLLQHDYRVITIDARNQGLSEHTAKGLRISRHAADVYELLLYLQLENVIGIGNSMGAATWFSYISIFGTQHLQAVVDIDQSPKMINTKNWPYGFKDLTVTNFASYLQQPFGRATYQNLPDKIYYQNKKLQQQMPYDSHLNYSLLLDHASQDWRDIICNLNIPLLVVAGQRSPFFDCHFAQKTAQLAPHGQAQVIAQAGHLPMAEQAQVFNQILDKFLIGLI